MYFTTLMRETWRICNPKQNWKHTEGRPKQEIRIHRLRDAYVFRELVYSTVVKNTNPKSRADYILSDMLTGS